MTIIPPVSNPASRRHFHQDSSGHPTTVLPACNTAAAGTIPNEHRLSLRLTVKTMTAGGSNFNNIIHARQHRREKRTTSGKAES